MKTIVSLAVMASMFALPGIASADKKGKGPKDYWKQQEKWDKELRKRDDKYWKDVEKRRKEAWKRYPYSDPWYGRPPVVEGPYGPYGFEFWP